VRDRLAPAKLVRLASRMLARDWRSGELTVLAAALVLAVGSMGTVAFFADRVKTALTSQAGLLLGADAMISSDRPLPDSFAKAARARGLASSRCRRCGSAAWCRRPAATPRRCSRT